MAHIGHAVVRDGRYSSGWDCQFLGIGWPAHGWAQSKPLPPVFPKRRKAFKTPTDCLELCLFPVCKMLSALLTCFVPGQASFHGDQELCSGLEMWSGHHDKRRWSGHRSQLDPLTHHVMIAGGSCHMPNMTDAKATKRSS